MSQRQCSTKIVQVIAAFGMRGSSAPEVFLVSLRFPMSGTSKFNKNSSVTPVLFTKKYLSAVASVGSEWFSESTRLLLAPTRLIAPFDVIHTAQVFSLPFLRRVMLFVT